MECPFANSSLIIRVTKRACSGSVLVSTTLGGSPSFLSVNRHLVYLSFAWPIRAFVRLRMGWVER